eukprot:g262.t1
MFRELSLNSTAPAKKLRGENWKIFFRDGEIGEIGEGKKKSAEELLAQKKQCEACLKMKYAHFGSDKVHPEIAKALHNFGSALHALGELDEAEKMFEACLKMQQTICEENKHELNIACTWQCLGNVNLDRCAFQRAKMCFERALAMYYSTHGDHAQTMHIAATMIGLGHVCGNRGELDDARTHYERSLQMLQKIGGADDVILKVQTSLTHVRSQSEEEADTAKSVSVDRSGGIVDFLATAIITLEPSTELSVALESTDEIKPEMKGDDDESDLDPFLEPLERTPSCQHYGSYSSSTPDGDNAEEGGTLICLVQSVKTVSGNAALRNLLPQAWVAVHACKRGEKMLKNDCGEAHPRGIKAKEGLSDIGIVVDRLNWYFFEKKVRTLMDVIRCVKPKRYNKLYDAFIYFGKLVERLEQAEPSEPVRVLATGTGTGHGAWLTRKEHLDAVNYLRELVRQGHNRIHSAMTDADALKIPESKTTQFVKRHYRLQEEENLRQYHDVHTPEELEQNLFPWLRNKTETCKVDLERATKMFGCKHPNTLDAMQNLGEAYVERGQRSDAASAFKKAARTRYDLLLLEMEQATNEVTDFVNKEPMDDADKDKDPTDATAIQQKRKKRMCTKAAYSTFCYARLFLRQVEDKMKKTLAGDGKPNDRLRYIDETTRKDLHHVELLATRARDLYAKVRGAKHPRTATAARLLGKVYEAQGEDEKALDLHRETLAIRKADLGDNHASTCVTMADISGVLVRLERSYPEAESMMRHAVDFESEIYGERNARTMKSVALLAKALRGNGKDLDAFKLEQDVKDAVWSRHGRARIM